MVLLGCAFVTRVRGERFQPISKVVSREIAEVVEARRPVPYFEQQLLFRVLEVLPGRVEAGDRGSEHPRFTSTRGQVAD